LYKDSKWRLSPAYDLTFSEGINGEHATTINGEGKNPSEEDILQLAKKNGISLSKAKDICRELRLAVKSFLK
jgi:serine/threonine-protein kinase HipA